MALPLPAVPAGSLITVEPVADGARITLPAPKQSWMRFLPAAFICFWLCGWAAGETFAVKALFGGFEKSGELEKGREFPFFAKLFLIGWLGAWTIGGLAAMRAAYLLLRPARSGRLVLTPDQLMYLPPSAALNSDAVKSGRANAKWRALFSSPAEIIIPRAEASEPRLERIGEILRLTVNRGAARFVIGETLTEPEMEWLSAVLERWKST